jgi:hypothetical protein
MQRSLRPVPARLAGLSTAFTPRVDKQVLMKKRKVLPPGASVKEFATAVGLLTKIQGWHVPILRVSLPDAENDCEVTWFDSDGSMKVNTVHRSEVRPPMIANDYTRSKVEKGEKQVINQVLRVLLCRLRGIRRAIVLDHSSLNTSHMLAGLDFTPADIHVPNPDLNITSSVGVITQQTLFQYLNAFDPDTSDQFHCLFDYCCTFEGGPLCQPTLDLHEMFRKTVLPRQLGVLWLTFSTRGTPGGGEAVAQTVESWLQAEALHFAYTLTLAYQWSYGTVVTLIYVTGREAATMDFSFLENTTLENTTLENTTLENTTLENTTLENTTLENTRKC